MPEQTDQPDQPEKLPYCRFLRTKKMYIPAYSVGGVDPRDATDTAIYWCMRTHTSIGPDHTHVHGSECRPGRRCCEVDL